MHCSRKLDAHSTAGDSRTVDSGFGIHGANFLREGTSRLGGRTVYHLLDTTCATHKYVTHSDFASELLAATTAADHLVPMATTLHEFAHGPLSQSEDRRLREEGGLSYRAALTIGTRSIFTAIAAATAHTAHEEGLARHLSWLGDLFRTGVFSELVCVDLHDMTAGGHTSGAVSRRHLLDLMKGTFQFRHAARTHPVRSPGVAYLLPGDRIGSVTGSSSAQ